MEIETAMAHEMVEMEMDKDKTKGVLTRLNEYLLKQAQVLQYRIFLLQMFCVKAP
jgi:hypothetical protein